MAPRRTQTFVGATEKKNTEKTVAHSGVKTDIGATEKKNTEKTVARSGVKTTSGATEKDKYEKDDEARRGSRAGCGRA